MNWSRLGCPLKTHTAYILHFVVVGLIPDHLLVGSNFLGPGTFPESFPSATPTTPNLAEFTQGPPPMSYQSDIPGSLLTADKSAPCLPGQVSAVPRGPVRVSPEGP